MFSYYLWLGFRSLRRHPWLTGLMILILSVGVAASMSTLTILHVMSADPIPSKSQRLFIPVLDNGPAEDYTPGEKPREKQLSYQDVNNLLHSPIGQRRVGLYGIDAVIEMPRRDLGVLEINGMAASRDFFGMLDVPFLFGGSWSEQDDSSGRDVVVLSRAIAEKMFGKTNPVGSQVTMWGRSYQVSGVMDSWRSEPKFYRYNGRGSAFNAEEQFIVPFYSAMRNETPHAGNMSCTGKRDPGWQALLRSECLWLTFWFEVRDAAERKQVQTYLDGYVSEQQKMGRFPRHAANSLFNVPEWLVEVKLVGDDDKLSAWLAAGFLLLCLVNTIGLLLAKFSSRAAEIGVRRALGASRRDIFFQVFIESGVIGLVGALSGMLLSLLFLKLIALQAGYLRAVAHMDWRMLLLTLLMSVAAALLAGLLPTWRACQISPALQLKSQ
ncbi:ABC transporter permease [Undibacterium rugosum]|uniref:ABC transporter permease n=1 Tax=Undibacterium rugosum TaxID=2762291 RepID=A0A923I106_9BURK|nr:FtsX-like permease family protein [Undibacterium rugosum]MBC3935671.1 ABC transporter permease [Undibacterium rugosum]MBR7778566.1 ABC transporter permease [Undibacterium rugosum]